MSVQANPSLSSSLSVVIPAFNEQVGIAATLATVQAHLESAFDRWEIIVVDDCSADATNALVNELADGERIRLLRNSQRSGKGAAVRKGVLESRFDAVLVTDADLSMPIEEVGGMLAMLDEAEVVIASKRCEAAAIDYPLVRRVLGGIGQLVIRTLVVRGVTDTQGGFKLFDGYAARSLFTAQLIPGFGYDFEVLYLVGRFGWRIREVPFRGCHRVGGSISFRSYLRTLTEVGQFLGHRLVGHYPKQHPDGAARVVSVEARGPQGGAHDEAPVP